MQQRYRQPWHMPCTCVAGYFDLIRLNTSEKEKHVKDHLCYHDQTMTTCESEKREEFLQGKLRKLCNCLPGCEEKDYKATVSSAYYPSPAALKAIRAHGFSNYSEDQIRKEFLHLKVFLQSMAFKTLHHNWRMSREVLLANVGGSLGLLLGASLLSLLELAHLLWLVCDKLFFSSKKHS